MKILSLCSGYGGLEMALQSVFGGEVVAHVEYDKHASKVLAHNFPGVPNLGDVKAADWTPYSDDIDWLTAGYPCQPWSLAGKRKGEDDDRHLWPGIAECLRVVRPRYFLFENVASHLSLGFDTVLGSVSGMGYNVGWGLVRASDSGATHRRTRLFIVGRRGGVAAHPYGIGDVRGGQLRAGWWTEPADSGEAVADTDGHGLQGRETAARPPAQRASSDCGGQRPGGPGPRSDSRDGVADGRGTERGSAEILRDLRGGDAQETLRERSTGGSLHLPQASELLAGVRQLAAGSDDQRSSLAGQEVPRSELRGLRDDGQAARSSRRSGSVEQRPLEPNDALRLLPSGASLAGRSRSTDGCGCAAWGEFAPAIHRWELILGRPAPAPSELSTTGGQHVSARAIEWMMGLPQGHVTAVPGLAWSHQVKILGNGVVPQQAELALRHLMGEW